MSHKSDQITRKGLERIREYCVEHEECEGCNICSLCPEFQTHLFEIKRETIIKSVVPRCWTDDDITKILKTTRNYMEAMFIESLKKIIERQGRCIGVKCNDCPFWHTDTNIDHKKNYCAGTSLYKVKNIRITERKEIAEWLLDIYKGERE